MQKLAINILSLPSSLKIRFCTHLSKVGNCLRFVTVYLYCLSSF